MFSPTSPSPSLAFCSTRLPYLPQPKAEQNGLLQQDRLGARSLGLGLTIRSTSADFQRAGFWETKVVAEPGPTSVSSVLGQILATARSKVKRAPRRTMIMYEIIIIFCLCCSDSSESMPEWFWRLKGFSIAGQPVCWVGFLGAKSGLIFDSALAFRLTSLRHTPAGRYDLIGPAVRMGWPVRKLAKA